MFFFGESFGANDGESRRNIKQVASKSFLHHMREDEAKT
jgi:hypothetical protein